MEETEGIFSLKEANQSGLFQISYLQYAEGMCPIINQITYLNT